MNYEIERTKEGLFFCGYMEYHDYNHYPRYLTLVGWKTRDPYYTSSPEELIELAKKFPNRVPITKREVFLRKMSGD